MSAPTPMQATALCPPSSEEETLRLFISLLGTTVADGNESIDANESHCPRLRALLSRGSSPLFGHLPRERVEASSDEDSVSSSHRPEASLFPSLALFEPASHDDTQDGAGPSNEHRYNFKSTKSKDSPSWPAETALRNLSLPIPVQVEEIPSASTLMSSRALDSFTFLVVANLRQFFKIQLQRHLNESLESTSAKAKEIASSFFNGIASGENAGCDQAMPIDVTSASTSFQIVDSVASGLNNKDGSTTRVLAASIVFNMAVEASIHGTKTFMPIKAPGTVEAFFAPGSRLIEQVKLAIDADKLLLSLRNQARALVLKAVACKDFPIICGSAGLSTASTDAKVGLGGKMQKLALCASLELASVIADDPSITNPKKPKRPVSSRKPLFRSNKRRIVSHAGPTKKPSAPSSMLSSAGTGQIQEA